MKDKEVCQNWIKILRDVFFTIYMYLVAQTKVNIIQQRTGESCIFHSFATNKPTLPPYTKKLAAERKFHPSTQSLIHDIRNFHKLLP